MLKNKKIYIVTAFSLSALSLLFCIWLLKGTKTSYAIDPGTYDTGFPTTTFTTNLTTSTLDNYINKAYGTDTSYANFLASFNVNTNYYDSKNTNPLYVLKKNLEIPTSKETFNGKTEDVKPVTDKGITYIINHGYNNTNSFKTIFTEKNYEGTMDNKIKQYITQIAIWLYIYENKSKYTETYCKNTGNGYDSCDFLDNSNNRIDATTVRRIITKAAEKENYEYFNYIIDLVDGAKNYNGSSTPAIGTVTSNLNYSYDKNNKVINIYNITPTITGGTENYLYYAVEVEDPKGYGVRITDKNGNTLSNTTQMTEPFSIVVPVNTSITEVDLSTINIKIYGYFAIDDNKSYVVTSSTSEPLPGTTSNLVVKYNNVKYDRFAEVTLGYTPYQILGTQFRLRNFTQISKVDMTNSNELPGATLVVTNKADSTKTWTWRSTNEPHMLSLENGNYTLCETIPPNGYQLETECIDFTVESNKVTTVTMQNKPIEVPDTGIFTNKLFIILGFFTFIGGAGLISYFTIYKKRNIIKEA